MNCCDCKEAINETERKGMRPCSICNQPMHAECVMSTPAEDDVCEACLYRDAVSFAGKMRAAGVTA